MDIDAMVSAGCAGDESGNGVREGESRDGDGDGIRDDDAVEGVSTEGGLSRVAAVGDFDLRVWPVSVRIRTEIQRR